MTTPTTVSVRLQLRADTAANWTSGNPVLLANELGRETDTGKIKIGDGTTAWTSLGYQPFGALITNADISATAEIAVSKLADGTARQLLQTDAAGTGVEWASNIDIPGTLDVTGAATFDSKVGVGTTSPSAKFEIGGIPSSGSLEEALTVDRSDGTQLFSVGYNSGTNEVSLSSENKHLVFANGASSGETARIDQNGRLLVGTSSARSTIDVNTTNTTPQFQIEGGTSESAHSLVTRYAANEFGGYFSFAKTRSASIGGHAIVSDDDSLGRLRWLGDDGTDFEVAAQIEAFVDGTPGTDDMPGRLVFSTNPGSPATGPTERMRITSAGDILFGTTSTLNPVTGTTAGAQIATSNNVVRLSRSGGATLIQQRSTSDGSIQDFYRDTTNVGSISVTTTATAYNTSSDYRLKENVVAVTDGITRLQQLKPSRFNFIADPAKTVDGFLAHEVQTIVPEAITGEKDAVDAEGNPEYQGIDQSKLVPLLTAALQEAVAEINALKDRLTAAGL